MTTHLEWETLNDYADGRLDDAARAAAAGHLEVCADCRDELAELRCLLAAASDVPDSIDPPAELWSEVRATLEARRQRDLPSAAKASGAKIQGPRWMTRPWLVAAAVVLMAVSSAVTALVVRPSDSPPTIVRSSEGPPVAAALPASFTRAERGYLESVEELQSLLDSQRDRLSPTTRARRRA
jgi:anti-sigma factor RsiW